MDLAGAEALYPTSKYAALFAKAREYGIPLLFMQVRQLEQKV